MLRRGWQRYTGAPAGILTPCGQAFWLNRLSEVIVQQFIKLGMAEEGVRPLGQKRQLEHFHLLGYRAFEIVNSQLSAPKPLRPSQRCLPVLQNADAQRVLHNMVRQFVRRRGNQVRFNAFLETFFQLRHGAAHHFQIPNPSLPGNAESVRAG